MSLVATVCSTNADSQDLVRVGAAWASRRSTIGRPNCLANAKSRSSWAGTAMIAPVP